VYLEARAVERTAHPEFVDLESIADFLARRSDTIQCEPQMIGDREWARCTYTDFPTTIIRYLVEQDRAYYAFFLRRYAFGPK
jgi:hypothetical protein